VLRTAVHASDDGVMSEMHVIGTKLTEGLTKVINFFWPNLFIDK